MISASCISLLLIVLAILYICETAADAAEEIKRPLIRIKFKVHITNGFTTNDNPLVIHCYSNDDDLGEHTLWMNGEFKFHFGISLFKTTHFWCSMKWGPKNKTIDVFGKYEYSLCIDTGNCFWKPSDSGIFFSEDNTHWQERYYWE